MSKIKTEKSEAQRLAAEKDGGKNLKLQPGTQSEEKETPAPGR
jgi:hypothetical protein